MTTTEAIVGIVAVALILVRIVRCIRRANALCSQMAQIGRQP